MKNAVFSVIGKKSFFRGEFNLKNSLKIYGSFEGNISSEGDVFIHKHASVKSNVKAKRVFVEGSVTGHINASLMVLISSTGNVRGDIQSPNLKIENGAITYGKIAINENNSDEK